MFNHSSAYSKFEVHKYIREKNTISKVVFLRSVKKIHRIWKKYADWSKVPGGLFYWRGLTEIVVWISNDIGLCGMQLITHALKLKLWRN